MPFDFWRPTVDEALLDKLEEDDKKLPTSPKDAKTPQSSNGYPTGLSSPVAAQAAFHKWELSHPWAKQQSGQRKSWSLPTEMDEILAVDESAEISGCPVELDSLAAYLGALRLDGEHLAACGKARMQRDAPLSQDATAAACLAESLTARYGDGALPPELAAAALMQPASLTGGSKSAASSSSCEFRIGDKKVPWKPPLAEPEEVNDEERGSNATAAEMADSDWRTMFGGSVLPIDRSICGPIGDVPTLPNPFTVSSDVAALVEQMLTDYPGDWDAKRLTPPAPLEPFPSLFHGPGGLLPHDTPRQLAQNAVVAAVLNRLSGNVFSAAARQVRESVSGYGRKYPEELARIAAAAALDDACDAAQLADEEQAKAAAALAAFHKSGEADMDKLTELQGMVGWKSGVAKQSLLELEEAERKLKETKEMEVASRVRDASAVWHSQWLPLLPNEAAEKQQFVVRLAPKAPALYTLLDFVEAVSLGFRDRTGGDHITKHIVEAAFVRQAEERLLLCVRQAGKESNVAENEMLHRYTHLPAPATVGTGLVDIAAVASGSSRSLRERRQAKEMRTIRPHHGLLLRIQGQTLSASVMFTAIGRRGVGFIGTGTNALTYMSPWNQVEYGDILWQQETKESLRILSLIAGLSALVNNRNRVIGAFPPVRDESLDKEVPLGTGALAILQAALFNDVKMWPVAFPAAARTRWDYAFRFLQNALKTAAAQGIVGVSQLEEELDILIREVLPQCERALGRIPNDSHSGDAGGCAGLKDRLQRMEMSALLKVPFRSATRFRKVVEETTELYSKFAAEVGLA
eukprot:TRINITY_DN70111_c0_g1_i1.p1 TRINITY_DN70111_c0_g1~~TRINITY_DN70111_c0_g1_i1.p1  ORF type:complete len:804 (+),score=205.35 TRINITY_DN70111_c0_g1_i1:71-2482(+)